MTNNEWYKIFQKKSNPYLNKSIDIIKKKKGKNYKTVSFELLRVIYDSNEFFFPISLPFYRKKLVLENIAFVLQLIQNKIDNN